MELKTKEHRNSQVIKYLIIALAVLVIIAITILLVIVRYADFKNTDDTAADESNITEDPQTLKKDNTETITFSDREIPINKNVRKNTLFDEAFSSGSDGLITYSDPKSQYGIDVSSFQGEIDWQKVRTTGIDFAIIRLGYRGMSEGLLYTDDYFEANLSGAVEAGLDVGIYFFSQATTEEEAVEEAEFVIEQLNGRTLQYPIFFDWEPGTDEVDRTYPIYSSDVINSFALAFCATVENAGYKTGIYFNSYQGYLQYDLSLFSETCLWLAEYNNSTPNFWYYFDIWQYSYTAKIDGIGPDVDMNICFIEDYTE